MGSVGGSMVFGIQGEQTVQKIGVFGGEHM